MAYSTALSRWMQNDPLGYVDSLDSYAYVGGSPLSYGDPLGLKLQILGENKPPGAAAEFVNDIVRLLSYLCPDIKFATTEIKKGEYYTFTELSISSDEGAGGKPCKTPKGCDLVRQLLDPNTPLTKIFPTKGSGEHSAISGDVRINVHEPMGSYTAYMRPTSNTNADGYAQGQDVISQVAPPFDSKATLEQQEFSRKSAAAILGHELIHAMYKEHNKRYKFYDESVSISTSGGKSSTVTFRERVRLEELITVGSPAYVAGIPTREPLNGIVVTENDLRRELGLPLRLSYGTPSDKK